MRIDCKVHPDKKERKKKKWVEDKEACLGTF